MVKHHVSYREDRTVNLTRKEHFRRHFGFGKCFMCAEKGRHKRFFAPVNPKTGKSFNDIFINAKTGNVNHPWPRRGRWILLCEQCKPKALGIRISSEGMR